MFCVLCVVFCVLCIVFCVLCFVFCVLCIVFCVGAHTCGKTNISVSGFASQVETRKGIGLHGEKLAHVIAQYAQLEEKFKVKHTQTHKPQHKKHKIKTKTQPTPTQELVGVHNPKYWNVYANYGELLAASKKNIAEGRKMMEKALEEFVKLKLDSDHRWVSVGNRRGLVG